MFVKWLFLPILFWLAESAHSGYPITTVSNGLQYSYSDTVLVYLVDASGFSTTAKSLSRVYYFRLVRQTTCSGLCDLEIHFWAAF